MTKVGFYEVVEKGVHAGETESAEVTLNHQQEFSESVNVVYSPPAIDPAKTASSEELTSTEIIDLPYAVPRDVRYALPLLPGVLQDANGQLHVDGSSTREIVDRLDGFNITDSGTGAFEMRVGVDALRSVDVQSSRYPAEYGKGSGGLISALCYLAVSGAMAIAAVLPEATQAPLGWLYLGLCAVAGTLLAISLPAARHATQT